VDDCSPARKPISFIRSARRARTVVRSSLRFLFALTILVPFDVAVRRVQVDWSVISHDSAAAR
jgi:hypothetical protein